MPYTYRGDRLTAPQLKGQLCTAVRQANGKCIRGSNSNMLVDFETQGRHVVLARQLRKMKALSLIQPWATLVLLGAAYKKNETRSWKTKHRGLLGIHASAGKPPYAREACNDPLIKAALDAHGLTFDTLPRAALLGTVSVVEMHEITPLFVASLSAMERAAGDYTIDAGRWAWELADVVLLPDPIPMKGGLSLWQVPE